MKISLTTCLLATLVSSSHAFAPSSSSSSSSWMGQVSSSSSALSKMFMSTDNNHNNNNNNNNHVVNRRESLGWMLAGTTGVMVVSSTTTTNAAQAATDVEDFLKTGGVSQPMGVSGQAGKSKPETGVVIRDGSDITRDSKSGNVNAEILLQNAQNEYTAALLSFTSPWSLAKGFVFDIECRDADTGDGVFVMVTPPTTTQDIMDLPNSFFVNQLVAPTGRFSFYGTPTDMKLKNNSKLMEDDMTGYRIMDVSFSTLAQSTQMEIPRKARMAATILPGSTQVVMLVASASATRWKKGADTVIDKTIQSFRAIPAPPTSLKLRAKERDPAAL
mmetsp:Transcript_15645/g.20607  ORF Transcript_15645/g.20607 Transcript_15645/m.20607 type:complete len:330 (-) Transcript_15645:82-1071(-)